MDNNNNNQQLIQPIKKPKFDILSNLKQNSNFIISKLSYSSLFYYGSLFFMISTSFNHSLQIIAKHKRKQKLEKLLIKLKEEYVIQDQSNSSFEVLFFIYFKCLNEIYEKENNQFKVQRRLLLEEKQTLSYIKTCVNYLKESLEYEQEIFEGIAKIFGINFDSIQLMFNKDLDLRTAKGKYFNTRKDIELPISLEPRKLDEIIKYLHKKYLEFIQFINDSGLQLKEEKILLVSEYFAFDSVYFEYDIEYEIIEKCLYQNNLNIVEYNI